MMSTLGSNNLDDAGDGNGSSRSSFLTNWTVAGGSLQVSCTVESSDSLIDSESVYAEAKPRLVLKRPSSDSGPCEITINFAQKHEVRQVYVRSTARVYEIYFAPSVQSGNEYLCTVRCGIVVRDDVLLVTETDAASGAQGEGSAEEVGEKCNNEGNIASNEHDWIEVEVPDSSLQDNQYNSVSKKVDPCPGTCVQDFYEATAEITDGDICKSLTLRLLSSQNKDCLYVDEIYVFADPVESADSDTQTSHVGNSAGSSLMAMLVPTLLQLSKKADNRRHAFETSEKGEQLEVGSRVSHSLNIVNKTQQEESISAQQEVKLHEANEATPETPDLQIPEKVKDGEQRRNFVAKTDVSSDRIDRALELLVSRVSRIEDICLRFEEHMLNPIKNMEARLQRVEQKLEILTKNSQFTGLPPSTRISAPAFSCIGSNLSSLYNEGSDYPACGTLQFEKEDFSSDKLSDLADDPFVSVNDTQFLPSLVVTAPEFPCGDDEEENDALEPLEDHPKEKSKQALSIDDALAAALAGFLYTSSVQHSHYNQTLTVKAPDFSIVECGDDGKVASPSAQSGKPCESDEMEQVNDPVMTSSITSPIVRMGQVTRDSSDYYLKEAFEGADGQDLLHEVLASYSSPGIPVNCPVVQVEHESKQTDDRQIAEPTSREGTNGVSISVSESTDFMKQFPGAQTEDTSDTLHEISAASFEDHGGSEKCYQMLTCFLPRDFELPILDVKFTSCETSSCYPSLEHLFDNVHEVDAEAQLVQPKDDGVIGEQSNLILVEDAKPNCSGTGLPLVDCNSYNVKGVPTAESKTQDSNACNESEVFASLI